VCRAVPKRAKSTHCWPTQPCPTAHGHPPCRLSTLGTHKLTRSRPPSPTHKIDPPDHLPHTQIQPTRLPSPHKFSPPDHLPRTQIRAPSPTKIHHLPHTKIDTPTIFPTQIRPPSHTNSSTFPAKNRHNFEHLPSQKIDTSVQSAGDFKLKNHD
jgi:hypothetical protein